MFSDNVREFGDILQPLSGTPATTIKNKKQQKIIPNFPQKKMGTKRPQTLKVGDEFGEFGDYLQTQVSKHYDKRFT